MAKKETKMDLIQFNGQNHLKDRSASRTGEGDGPAGGIVQVGHKKSKKMILIVGILGTTLMAGGIGIAGFYGFLPFFNRSTASVSEEGTPKKPEIGETIKLSPLIINLNEESGRHYLKTTIVLELDDKKWAEMIQQRMSLLTDMVILIISDKKLEEMRANDFKERLREELLVKFNDRLGHRGIRQIYFDEFLFQ